MTCGSRAKIKTGDLLVWGQPYGDVVGIMMKIVRLFTISEYGHVSIAWDIGGELFHIEATTPKIRVAAVPLDAEFYVIPMSRFLKKPGVMSFFNDKIGNRYSVMDALRAYFGITTEVDDQWQCAELAHAFYEDQGLVIEMKAKTPAKLVRTILAKYNTTLFSITKETDCVIPKS